MGYRPAWAVGLAAILVAILLAGCIGGGSTGDGDSETPEGDREQPEDAVKVYENTADNVTLRIAWNDARREFALTVIGRLDVTAYALEPERTVSFNLDIQCTDMSRFAYNYSGWVAEIEREGGRFSVAEDERFPEHVLREYEPERVRYHMLATQVDRELGRCAIHGEDNYTKRITADWVPDPRNTSSGPRATNRTG